ncbi:MAG: serine hydroxymethyltransferase [Thermoplasma acidophilum]|nr:serine hydroxymethyltransferase [Thermoplasma acidophilum]
MSYEDAEYIREMAMKHSEMFGDGIALIASENVMSPLAKEVMISDLESRYAEGLPHHRYYQGNYYVDLIEDRTNELLSKLFRTSQTDPRPISGTNANSAAIYALAGPGDLVATPSLSGGGHISAAEFGILGMRSVRTINYPYDKDTMTIDPDQASKMIIKEKPKVCLFGQSVFLFPAPLKEMAEAFQEVGCKVWYDGAHVLGLIAGGRFQDPLREGADIVTGSTHKTFPGPQHGVILGNTDDETWKAVRRAVFPGVLSNHHLNAMAALGITAAEELEFGKKYADDVISNAKVLAEELYANGFDVLAEKRGFTESHTMAVDVSKNGGGKYVAETLEKCGIILNKNLLPWDDNKKSQNPSGIRIGVQEATRVGMGKSEMKEIASLITRAIIKHEDPEKIKAEVKQLKSGFREVKYCYGKMDGYSYIKLI